ncbi:MAG: heat-inducible transcriptional repressor HrcA [Candidatus Acidiferrales bacterium]
MRSSALQTKRNQQILAELVRTYIETGEPVSSRTIARKHAEALSPATVRNIMADLEEEGFLYQPHTSAGRIPTAEAYRFFVEEIAPHATVDEKDREWIRRELAAAATPEALMERAGHVLASVSKGLGIIIAPPLARTAVEHMRFLLLPDGRVLVVLIAKGGLARDKFIRPESKFAQDELDRIAEYVNQRYSGWTLQAIRVELAAQLTRDRERYDLLARGALELCNPNLLAEDSDRQVYVEGAAQMAATPEFAGQDVVRELLETIEERGRLIALLSGCIEAPEPVHVELGVKEMSGAGKHLTLISAPYASADQAQGTLGILGPMRMQYERVITAVAFMSQLFNENLRGEERK